MSMSIATNALGAASTVLLVDWPSSEVPASLVEAGYEVFVKSGPEPDSYSVRELRDGEQQARPIGRAPARADVVYCHRPLEELPAIISIAKRMGAHTVWLQSGLARDGSREPTGCWLPNKDSEEARKLVEQAGITYIDNRYLPDVVRELRTSK